MGTVVSAERFMDAYIDKNGMPPISYFMNHDIQLHGTVPDIASMGLFLHRGEVWAEPPWKRATFFIPEVGREEAAQNFLLLWPDFVGNRRMAHLFNHVGRIIGAKFMLFGTSDDRGRPIIEGFMEKPGEVWKVNYLRRKQSVAGEKPQQEAYVLRRSVVSKEEIPF